MAVRVLVVDDNELTAEALGLGLELLGYTVAIAHGGAQALELSDSFSPEVVLLDLAMPQMDGYECARRLRTSSDVPLIAISGYDDEADTARGRASEFVIYLAKPLELQLVVQAVQTALAR